jgi:hypothetical protein
MSLPIKKKREYRENKTQKAYLEWLALQHRPIFENTLKIDNEGTTNRAEAIRCGLHVGASDLFHAWPTLKYYGLWMEIKPEGWKLTKSKQEHHERQIAFGAKMMKRGYHFAFCVGVDECIAAMKEYLKG